MTHDLNLAIKAAKEASAVVRNNYKKRQSVEKKGVNDFVTQTDKEAEKVILNCLKETNYSILSEEAGLLKGIDTTKQWIVDPIDGTANFVRGIPFFSVSIALMDKDEITVGVVCEPLSGNCYWASQGGGAFNNNSKLCVSKQSEFEGSIILVEHNRKKTDFIKYLEASRQLMANNNLTLLRQGSTALMLCYVASGQADAFLSYGDEIYDYAGGLIIAKEAGALVTDCSGKPWDKLSTSILVSTPKIQQEILGCIR